MRKPGSGVMGAIDACLEPDSGYAVFDFYDGLAALLRISDAVSCQGLAPLQTWLPRVQGYLNVALKHLPEAGGADYAQSGWARQWRAAQLLLCALPVSARWLQQQLIVECGILADHPGFRYLREILPEDAAVVVFFARRGVDKRGLFRA